MLSKLSASAATREEQVQPGTVNRYCKFCKKIHLFQLKPAVRGSVYNFYCEKCDLGFLLEESYKIHLEGFTHNYNPCEPGSFVYEQLHPHYPSTQWYGEVERRDKPRECATCYKKALDEAMTEHGLSFGETSAMAKKTTEKKTKKKEEEIRKKDEKTKKKTERKNKEKKKSNQKLSRFFEGMHLGSPSASSCSSTTTSTLSTDEERPSTSSRRTTQLLLLQAFAKRKPSVSMQTEMTQRIEAEGSYKLDACTQTNFSEDVPKNPKNVWIYVYEKRTPPPLQFYVNSKGELDGRPLIRSKSCEWPGSFKQMDMWM